VSAEVDLLTGFLGGRQPGLGYVLNGMDNEAVGTGAYRRTSNERQDCDRADSTPPPHLSAASISALW